MGRVRTGIPDLDLILGGGLEPGSLVVLAGAPGTGKTILAQQICFANATQEHKARYYTTLSEPHSKLVRHLEPFEFFKPAALGRCVDFIHLGELVQEAPKEGLGPIVSEVVPRSFETRPTVVVIDSAKALRDFVSEHELRAWKSGQLMIHYVPVGELDLDTIAAAVRRELANGSTRRVVIDSLAELVFAAREADRFPAYSRSLVGWIRAVGASVVITSETTTLGPMTEPIGGLSFLFHNVILLRYLEIGSELRGALNIIKMRTSNHDKGVFEYVIDQNGLTIKDRLEGVTGVLGWSALRTQG